MTADLVYVLAGMSLFLAVLLPVLLDRIAISAPMVLLLVGALIGLLPQFGGMDVDPRDHPAFTEHLTEVTVIVALMGVGLALDRPLDLRKPRTWHGWGTTWRLLGIAMPLTIASVALVGWGLGLAPAAAILLGAVLAPTDPVLASDVQVAGPTSGAQLAPEEVSEIDERDEVRFALTSEAGLNDGLAFPFVYFAIMVATMGPLSEWGLSWFAWELVGKIVVGVAVGAVVGWGLAKVAFRSSRPALRLAETGEPLLALAAVLLSYGLAEVSGGYGFLSVFACGMALRSAERGHEYHAHMHGVVERLERLLTLAVLLLLGVAMTNGLLQSLTWEAVALSVCLIFVFRPVAGWVSLGMNSPRPRPGSHALGRRERRATALLGVRGVGSLYYIAYGTNQADFGNTELLWATVAFTVALSVIVHGVAAKPVMRRLDADRAV